MTTIIKILASYLTVVLGSAIIGFMPVWALWNWLCPQLFGFDEISIIQSFGLITLVGCVFGAQNGWAEVKI